MAYHTEPQTRPIVTRAEAKAGTLKRFFTGKPCKWGHVSERYSSGQCVACVLTANHSRDLKTVVAWNAAYRTADPEGYRARRRAYRVANLEKVRAQEAAWRTANPEKLRAQKAAWMVTNISKVRIQGAARKAASLGKSRLQGLAWRLANPEKYKAKLARYYVANPEKFKVYRRNRRARIAGAGGKHTVADIVYLMKLQGGKCAHAWCKISLKRGHHVDHIIPLVLDGSNDRRNLQLLCQPCNSRKYSKHPIDFAQQNGMLL